MALPNPTEGISSEFNQTIRAMRWFLQSLVLVQVISLNLPKFAGSAFETAFDHCKCQRSMSL